MAFLLPDLPDITNEGPRVDEFTISDSAYGRDIPRGYGTVRLGGNIIWSSDIREEKIVTEEEVGGKGGGGQTVRNIEYFYRVSFAIAFTGNECSAVNKVWANSEIILDFTESRGIGAVEKYNYRIYYGTEDQLQDPVIQADKGDAIPAFRGLTYIVFEDMLLNDFGNGIPSMSAELTLEARDVGDAVSTVTYPTLSSSLDPVSVSWVDWNRQILYVSESGVSSEILALDMNSYEEIYRIIDNGNGTAAINQKTGAAIRTGAGSPNTKINVYIYEPATDTVLYSLINSEQFGIGAAVIKGAFTILAYGENASERSHLWGILVKAGSGTTPEVHFLTYNLDPVTLNVNFLGELWVTVEMDQDFAPDGTYGFITPTQRHDGYGGTVFGYYNSTEVILKFAYVQQTTQSADASGVRIAYNRGITDIKTLNVTDIDPLATTINGSVLTQKLKVVMDQSAFNLYMFFDLDTGYFCVKYDIANDVILWNTEVNYLPSVAKNFFVTGSYIAWRDSNTAIKLDADTGQFLEPYNGSTSLTGLAANNNHAYIYNDLNDAFISRASPVNNIEAQQLQGYVKSAFISDIIDNLTEKVGLDAVGHSNTNDITGQVGGYIVHNNSPAKEGIVPLSKVFQFDAIERDGFITYIQRGNSSSVTISEDDFILKSKGVTTSYKTTREQEAELPRVLTIDYKDSSMDDLDNTVTARRIKSPSNAVRSNSTESFKISVFDTANNMKQAAEKLLYSAWIERNSYEYQLAQKYLYLDSTDVITINLNNGDSKTVRIESGDIGKDFSTDIESRQETTTQYISSATGATGNINTQGLAYNGFSQFFIIDSPLLLDTHSESNYSLLLYDVMSSYGSANWPGANLYVTDPVSKIVDLKTTQASWGVVQNVIGNPDSHQRTDDVNTITVFMAVGGASLSSVTYSQMLNGLNGAWILKENGEVAIIQYQNVTDNGDGTYTLDTLFRGRKGTDTMDKDYLSGEYFIPISSATVGRFPQDFSMFNVAVDYKCVTIGGMLENSPIKTVTNRARSLMPYAPVHPTATLDGSNNIDFAWVRRTRINGEVDMADGGDGTVPINETVFRFDIDIYSGGSIVRTITDNAGESYQYTAADQTTDGFTPGSVTSIEISIFQKSGEVGRGFEGNYTIEVA